MLKHLQIHELFVNVLMLKISIFSQIALILLVKKWPGEASWYRFSKNNACHQSGCPEFSSWNPLSERRELVPLSCLLTATQALQYAWVLSLFSLCLSAFPLLSLQHMHYLSLYSPPYTKWQRNPGNGNKSVFNILKLSEKNIFLVNIGIHNLWFWNEVPISIVSGNTNILSKDLWTQMCLVYHEITITKIFPNKS